jgi:hypothetical protein
VEELPSAAQKLRGKWTANINHAPTAIDKVQEAARAIDETAAAAATPAPGTTPRGVARVSPGARIPGFRLSSGWIAELNRTIEPQSTEDAGDCEEFYVRGAKRA